MDYKAMSHVTLPRMPKTNGGYLHNNPRISKNYRRCNDASDRLCGLVVRVLGYRSGGPGSIPGTTKKT
jgi:hypothetical protein